MPTTALMPLPKQQYFSALGTPLLGGKLYTYAAGTSTPKETYTDSAGTAKQPNPILLNLRGEPDKPIFWSGNYRVELRNIVGDLIYSVDNYNTDPAGVWGALTGALTQFAAAAGASLIGFIQAGAGAVARTLQAKSREVVSITDFGATTASPDNADAIEKAIAYMKTVGGELDTPRGRFLTSGNHSIDASGGVISIRGRGPAASVWVATGTNTPLSITGASECAVRSMGFDKTSRDQAGGDGLRIFNTAYAVIDHVTAYGFLNGIKTDAVLTTLLSKTLTRFCDIGVYLGRGTQSCPNAISMLNCSSSLNNRFGLRVDEGATINVSGGSVEGNGWGATAIADGFHGGMYLSNCGTEGGVGITIDNVQMEQNQGKGDIWIATTKNPETVYNIVYNTIFPISDDHYTDNAIYVEHNVAVSLNVYGNSFKHIGTYTPNAARKYIKTESPSLLTVNTGGDYKQFFSALQRPDIGAWGPNVYRGSMLSASASVNNGGAASISGSAYNVGVVTRTAVGTVVCTFVKPLSTADYRVSLTPGLGAKTITWTLKSTDFVTVETRDLTGTLVDSSFDVMVAGGL